MAKRNSVMASMGVPFWMAQRESSLRGWAGPPGMHSLGTGGVEEVLMSSSGVLLRDVALLVLSGSPQSLLVYHISASSALIGTLLSGFWVKQKSYCAYAFRINGKSPSTPPPVSIQRWWSRLPPTWPVRFFLVCCSLDAGKAEPQDAPSLQASLWRIHHSCLLSGVGFPSWGSSALPLCDGLALLGDWGAGMSADQACLDLGRAQLSGWVLPEDPSPSASSHLLGDIKSFFVWRVQYLVVHQLKPTHFHALP